MKKSGKKTKSETGPELDLSKVDEIISRFKADRGALIPVLQEIQEHYGYIPQVTVSRIAQGLKLFPSSIYGVMTFYAQFHLKPRGKNMVRVCCGTACHVRGVERVSSKFKEILKVSMGETTDDRVFTLDQVACIGACSLAPAVMVNEEVHGKVTPDEVSKILDQYSEEKTKLKIKHQKSK
jgi:NADH-quinone oxidoreductase subunit E